MWCREASETAQPSAHLLLKTDNGQRNLGDRMAREIGDHRGMTELSQRDHVGVEQKNSHGLAASSWRWLSAMASASSRKTQSVWYKLSAGNAMAGRTIALPFAMVIV